MTSIEGCPYVFSTNGRTPVSGFSKAKARLDSLMEISDWRLHNLRRTAAIGMARLGCLLTSSRLRSTISREPRQAS